MKSDIQLDINTKYNGEGLKKLEQGLNKANNVAKTATGAVGQITTALGGLQNKAGQAVGALTGLFQSFTQGGVWGLAIAGVMMVVNKVVDAFNKAKEASKEAAESVRKNWVDALDKISQKANTNITVIEKSRKTQSEKYNLDTQHLTQQQMIEVEKVKQAGIARRAKMTDDEKAVDKANEDIQIAKMEQTYSVNSGNAKLNEIDSQKYARLMGQKKKDTAASKLKSLFEKYSQQAIEAQKQLDELKKKQDEEVERQLRYNPDGVSILSHLPYQEKIDQLTRHHTVLVDRLYGSKDDKGKRKSDEGLESKYEAAKKAADDYRSETYDLNLDEKRRNIITQNQLDDIKQTTSVKQAEERLSAVLETQKKKKEADQKIRMEKSATINEAVDKLMDDSSDDIKKQTRKNQLVQMLSGVQSSNQVLANVAKDETKTDDERKTALNKLAEGKKKETDIQQRLNEIQKQEIDARRERIKQLNDDKLKKLNDELETAKDAVSKWKEGFDNNKDTRFADWNKQMIEDNRRGDVVIGQDENGEDIKISGRQARNVEANKKTLERLRKIKNPNQRTQDEIARREKFDDMFNPDKIKKRQDAVKAAEKEKEKLMKQQADDLKKIKEAIVGGVTL